MKKKDKSPIIFIAIIAVIVIVVVAWTLISKRLITVPEGTVGNTAGNLNNRGLFCEYDGKVYFSNAYDNGALYVMNPDESGMKKLNNAQAEYINAGGNFLVYYQKGSTGSGDLKFIGAMNGVYRCKLNGKNAVCLDDDPSGTVLLIDNYVYYAHYDTDTALTLRKIHLNKTKAETLTDYWVNPACFSNGKIYYNGTTEDHNLYTYNIDTNVSSTILEGNMWNPVVVGDFIYYQDLADNYKLCSYSMLDGSIETLTQDRVEFFNIYETMIYYQSNSTTDPALKRMSLDGSGLEVVYPGNYCNINITSEFVYFNEFNADFPVYKTSTFGPVNVQTFSAAQAAAIENMD